MQDLSNVLYPAYCIKVSVTIGLFLKFVYLKYLAHLGMYLYYMSLVSSLSKACARLHWAKIYIVAVMEYKNAQALSAACNDFPLEYLIRLCWPPNKVIIVCIL